MIQRSGSVLRTTSLTFVDVGGEAGSGCCCVGGQDLLYAGLARPCVRAQQMSLDAFVAALV